VNAYAATTETAADARDALAALPHYSPLPPFLPGSPAETNVGTVLLLAERYDEAITHLRKATASCMLMDDPVGHTRAHLRLGQAYAVKGEKDAACAALRVVGARWDQARPRSVTLEAARAKMLQLGCPK
jgi:serine/threonine-protein kinase